jgi:hypothetical protein
MEAYGTNDAQLQVQQFSSTKYKSHRSRHIPDFNLCGCAPNWACSKILSHSVFTQKKPSWGAIHDIKGCISARGNKFRIFLDGAKSLHTMV